MKYIYLSISFLKIAGDGLLFFRVDLNFAYCGLSQSNYIKVIKEKPLLALGEELSSYDLGAAATPCYLHDQMVCLAVIIMHLTLNIHKYMHAYICRVLHMRACFCRVHDYVHPFS